MMDLMRATGRVGLSGEMDGFLSHPGQGRTSLDAQLIPVKVTCNQYLFIQEEMFL